MRYATDFETTTPQEGGVGVWLAGFVSEDYQKYFVCESIGAYIGALSALEHKSTLYFCNLKFDGSFILDYLLRAGFKPAIVGKGDRRKFCKDGNMPDYSFKCFINNRGVWYNIAIKFRKKVIYIRDSLKVLPFSLRDATTMLGVENQKLTMDYRAHDRLGLPITEGEREYFKHDLYGLMECLNIVWHEMGIEKVTIGAQCLHDYKRLVGRDYYERLFPNLYEIFVHGIRVYDWILSAYHGGWVYVDPQYQRVLIIGDGKILDVTSLYSSVMHSRHGVEYPVGKPRHGKGKCKKQKGKYYYQRIRCEFRLKQGKLPFVRIKNSYLYNSRECLTTSDVKLKDGTKMRNPVELTFTQTEIELFFEHYDVIGCVYVDYMQFYAQCGMFDDYINKWIKLKEEAPNKGKRMGAKLMQNNLYGKFAAKPDNSFRIPFINADNDVLAFEEVECMEATPGYIAVGAAITSEALCFNVKYAQLLKNEGRFCYSDTDSIHCIGDIPEEIPIAEGKLCTYKVEGNFTCAWYQNAKRYIEIVDGKCEITAAGLPDRGKDLFRASCGYIDKAELGNLTESEEAFIANSRMISDFDVGISIPGKLRAERRPGGIMLMETNFTIL